MEDLKTVQPEAGNTPKEEERTFTQEEVNHIVQERLAKERQKSTIQADPLAEREKLLTEREKEFEHSKFMREAESKLVERNVPIFALDALNISSPEAFEKSLELFENAVIEYVHNNPAPPIPPSGLGTAQVMGSQEDAKERLIEAAFGLK